MRMENYMSVWCEGKFQSDKKKTVKCIFVGHNKQFHA